MRCVGEIKDRYFEDAEIGVIHLGVLAEHDIHFFRVERPLRIRQRAGCNGSVVHDQAVVSRLHDEPALEQERVGTGENDRAPSHPRSNGSDHVIEPAVPGLNVVGCMTGFDMLVVGAAVKHYPAARRDVPALLVVGDLLGAQHVHAIVDLDIALQFVNVALLFDRPRVDRDFLAG